MRWACTAQNGHQHLNFMSMFFSCIISEQFLIQATGSIKMMMNINTLLVNLV